MTSRVSELLQVYLQVLWILFLAQYLYLKIQDSPMPMFTLETCKTFVILTLWILAPLHQNQQACYLECRLPESWAVSAHLNFRDAGAQWTALMPHDSGAPRSCSGLPSPLPFLYCLTHHNLGTWLVLVVVSASDHVRKRRVRVHRHAISSPNISILRVQDSGVYLKWVWL